MRIKEERGAEMEWRWQEAWERRREVNRKREMMEIKCFVCREFGHIICNCRNMENRREGGSIPISSNIFEVLRSRVMNIEESSGREIKKNKKMILREQRTKKEKSVEI